MTSMEALEVEIDLEAALVTVSRDGATVGRMPWPVDSGEAGSAVVRMTYTFGGRAVTFTTRLGDSITAEFPDQTDFAPVHQRPIIYLDQNHWSALAKALHEPEAVHEPVRVAAERLASLARKRTVILPLSLGHMGETGQWGNDPRRYRLALTMLELSAGWQPSLGIFRELLHEKLADPGTVWEQNDLTDMMYLSCGAAYADHVVGERRLIGDLRCSLARLGQPSNVHSKLADLVRVLDDGIGPPKSATAAL